MLVINERNVNYAYSYAMWKLGAEDDSALHESYAVKRNSRNGPVLEFPTPVTTVYQRPLERVLFDPVRDANPFFHVHEALWMLGGRNDLASLGPYKHILEKFSDDGDTLHGAYGYRWRKAFILSTGFHIDQLMVIAQRLKANPEDRRCVLQMWDANYDLDLDGKDVPCNTAAYFKIRAGRLDMTVTNRSNDIIWGAYGANAVHFSFLQEYMAYSIGVPVGVYYQVSDNLHAYVDVYEKVKNSYFTGQDYYAKGDVKSLPLINAAGMETIEQFDDDLALYFRDLGLEVKYKTDFFNYVAEPMRLCYRAWKAGEWMEAFDLCCAIKAEDWQVACANWLGRRQELAYIKKMGGTVNNG